MIVLRKNDNIVIPNYNDLDNKPKINGVTLEGSLTTEDLGITGVDVDLSNYYTKIQSDNRFQPKGSYATIGQLNTVNNNINDKFDDYYDKSEIDEIIAGIEVSGSDIPYVVISNENNQLTSFGNLTDVINASINKTPYLAYLYNNNALPIGKGMYELQHVEYNETTGIGLFRVHIDKGAAHVNLDFNFEKNNNEFVLTTVSQDVIHYAQQNYVDSAMNYITANYQPKGNYLTSVPSEYVTETELNNAIEGLGGSDIPYVVIDYAGGVGQVIAGDLNSVLNTAKNKESFLAYFYNTSSNLGNYYTLYPFTAVQVTDFGASLSFHYEESSTQHKTVTITCSFNSSTNTYKIENVSTNTHNYLTSIPSEYVTETELNDAIAGLGGGSDVPYVVIEYRNAMTLTPISGDLQATMNAAKNKQPFLAYFYNTYATFGKTKTLYPFTYVTVDGNNFSLEYHTEVGSVHKDVTINGSYDATTGEYSLATLGQNAHPYATTTELNAKQDTLVSGTNIKTINGNSILGSGNLEITTDLSNYYTKTEIDTQIGDVNTILENIIG